MRVQTGKTLFLILFLGFFSSKLSAFSYVDTSSAFHKIIEIEAIENNLYELKLPFEFTSVVIDYLEGTQISESFILIDNRKTYFQQDEHIETGTNFLRSNIIVFNKTSNANFFSGSLNGKIRLHLLFAPKIFVPEAVIQFKTNDFHCHKPESIHQNIWRQGLPAPAVKPAANKADHVIIHHSATSNSQTDYVSVVRNIYLYHTQINGWDDVGYNYLIAPNGLIFNGRDAQQVADEDNILGAHFCSKNTGTMGICILGDYNLIQPSDTALGSLIQLASWKLNKEARIASDSSFHPPGQQNATWLKNLAGHRNGCATECPGDSLYLKLPFVRYKVDSILQFCTPPVVDIYADNEIHNFKIYPQPVQDVLYFQLNEKLSGFSYVIYDFSGKLISSGNLTNQNYINVSELSKGFYIINVQTNNKNFIGKFIK